MTNVISSIQKIFSGPSDITKKDPEQADSETLSTSSIDRAITNCPENCLRRQEELNEIGLSTQGQWLETELSSLCVSGSSQWASVTLQEKGPDDMIFQRDIMVIDGMDATPVAGFSVGKEIDPESGLIINADIGPMDKYASIPPDFLELTLDQILETGVNTVRTITNPPVPV